MNHIGNHNDRVLAAPIYLADDEARKGILSYFPAKGLPDNWGVMYIQTEVMEDEKFLCTNWAGHRVKKDLVVGQAYPFTNEHPIDAPHYDVGERNDLLAQLDLWDKSKGKLKFIEECKHDDRDRMLIIWAKGKEPPAQPDKGRIVHMSVKWDDRWESKLSNDFHVITHEEDSFRRFAGHDLYPAAYYKRTKKA